jgi:hypothetical protein
VRHVDVPEPGVEELAVGVLEALRQAHLVRLGHEHRGVAVGVDQRGGEVLGGQPRHLLEHVVRRLGVQVGVRTLTQHVVAAEDFEQVEGDVTQVGLVMAHAGPLGLKQTRGGDRGHSGQHRVTRR